MSSSTENGAGPSGDPETAHKLIDLLQVDLMDKKEAVILNLYRLEIYEKKVHTAERDSGVQQGAIAALDTVIQEFTKRSSAFHTSVQEKRILSREIQQLSLQCQEAKMKGAQLKIVLREAQKKHLEVREALSTSLSSFLGMGQSLLDTKGAGQAVGVVAGSWKDHELIRLAQRIKELEAVVSPTEP